MATGYLWEQVTVEVEDGEEEFVDCDGFADAKDLRAAVVANPEILTGTGSLRLRLVQTWGDEFGSEGRDEAFVVGGRLPERFEEERNKVPARFHAALAALVKAAGITV